MKKTFMIFVLLSFFMICSIAVLADVSINNLVNGEAFLESDGVNIKTCKTSDGGTVAVEYAYDTNGFLAVYYNKLDSSNVFTTTKKLVYTFGYNDLSHAPLRQQPYLVLNAPVFLIIAIIQYVK